MFIIAVTIPRYIAHVIHRILLLLRFGKVFCNNLLNDLVGVKAAISLYILPKGTAHKLNLCEGGNLWMKCLRYLMRPLERYCKGPDLHMQTYVLDT